MDHRKCKCCHHEWDGARQICDWCGSASEVIGKSAAVPYAWLARKMARQMEQDAKEG